MKSIVLTSFGGPDALQLRDVPEPTPSGDEVIVRIETVGINFADVRAAQGKYPGSPEPPFISGREFCGVVEQTGERVMGYTQFGACAEKIAISPALLFPAPPRWDAETCAAFPVNYLTAWFLYWKSGIVRAGHDDPSPVHGGRAPRVLIHACGGGVGTAAVQVGRKLGCETFGTASSDEKLEKVKELGLTHGINYVRDDYEQKIKELTGGEGVDAVFDGLAGEHTAHSLRCCGFLGRVILFGSASDDRPKFDVMSMYVHSASVHGLWLSKMVSKPELIRAALESMHPWIESGEIKPVVGHVLRLEQTADAHRMMLERRNYGKIVIRVW